MIESINLSIDAGIELEVDGIGKLALLEHIRTGGSATVWTAQDDDGKLFAVKVHRARRNSDQHELDISRESTCIAEHPNICGCIGSGIIELSDDRRCHSLVFPLFEHDELADYMHEDLTGTRKIDLLSIHTKISVCAKIIEGIGAIHEAGWLHGDISLRNILYDADSEELRIIDFEFSRPVDESPGDGQINRGTREYTAPEVDIHGIKAASESSDVWAVGLLLAYILDSSTEEYLRDIGGWRQWKEQYDSTVPILPEFSLKEVPTELWQYIRQCTIINRDKRPSINELSGVFNDYLESD